jgi:hypothetical protein
MEKRTHMRSMPLFFKPFSKEMSFFTMASWQFPIFSSLALRQILSFVLAFILLINSIGYYPLYKLKQWEIHTEMKSLMRNGLANESLQCISISEHNKHELDWEWQWETEQEFTYKNNRYDVVRKEVKDHVTSYFCIQDAQETKLFSKLEKEVEQQMDDEKTPLQSTTKKLIKTCYWIVPLMTDCQTSTQAFNYTSSYSIYHCLYSSTFLSRITPPPKQVVS